MRVLFVVLTAVSLAACGTGALTIDDDGLDEAFTDKGKAVVYGTDNRTDVFAHPDATLRQRALQSTVALIPADIIDASNPGNVRFWSYTLAQAEDLCSGQRFANDPTASGCSGTLIGDDLVLTAGHCVSTASECASTRFVFQYAKASASSLETISTADIFSCAGVVARAITPSVDYAVVRLNRSASPRFTPAPVRRSSSSLVTGARVAVIGTGSGVPFKIDSGGMVRDPSNGVSFEVNTDTFSGNSGSAVYELDGYSVAGILVEGDTDYVSAGACNVVNVCPERGCSGETVIAVNVALTGLCRAEPSNRLCTQTAPAPVGSQPVPQPSGLAFQASATRNATRNAADQTVRLRRGQTLLAGTCNVAGSFGTADTFVRIVSAASRTTVARNDDACGQLSFVQFTAPADGDYIVRAGCYADTACSGTVAWEVR